MEDMYNISLALADITDTLNRYDLDYLIMELNHYIDKGQNFDADHDKNVEKAKRWVKFLEAIKTAIYTYGD